MLSIESGIRDHGLPAGGALPTVRGLAGDLGVAPGTVAAAYRQLRERGLLESRGRGGTFVRVRPAMAGRALTPIGPDLVDLASGQPDPALLPELGPLWSRLPAGSAAAPVAGLRPELAELTRQRLVADGVPAKHLTVAHGGLDAVQRLLEAHLRFGSTLR